LAFAVGGAAAAVLHLRFGWRHIWSVLTGITAYAALDIGAELALFGHLA